MKIQKNLSWTQRTNWILKNLKMIPNSMKIRYLTNWIVKMNWNYRNLNLIPNSNSKRNSILNSKTKRKLNYLMKTMNLRIANCCSKTIQMTNWKI